MNLKSLFGKKGTAASTVNETANAYEEVYGEVCNIPPGARDTNFNSQQPNFRDRSVPYEKNM